MNTIKRIAPLFLMACIGLFGCKKETPPPARRAPAKEGKSKARPMPPRPTASTPGVDAATKTITIGSLDDQSGPAAAIGQMFADGKRLLVANANDEGSKLLPAGWKLKLLERDHHYEQDKALRLYKELKDQILFITTSFGTHTTLPLRDQLKQDNIIAFPASLSSQIASHENTPPIGASYKIEAMRAMDWAVKKFKGAKKVRAAIIYQDDDYGQDALAGWEASAAHHKVKIVAKKGFSAKALDYAAALKEIKRSRANIVMLAVLPSATVPILVGAAKMRLRNIWVGNTPTWVDVFFYKLQGPKSAIFRNFYWVSSVTFWGEKVPGMDEFVAAYQKHKATLKSKLHGFYTFISYVQGLVQLEAVRRALAKGPLNRATFKAALRSIKDWNAGGLIKPIDLTQSPYVTTTQSRILKPDFKKKSWVQIDDYASPQGL